MNERITYHIGEDDESVRPRPSLKAFFYWKDDEGSTIRRADYSKDELAAEINRRREAEEDAAVFEEAFQLL